MRSEPFTDYTPFLDKLGRRACQRLHLCVPARLISVVDTRSCLLVDVSLCGARIALQRPLAVHASGYLRVGPVQVFGTAVRFRPSEEGGGINGVEFDDRLTKSQVLALRAYAENYELSERRESLIQARDWVMGGG